MSSETRERSRFIYITYVWKQGEKKIRNKNPLYYEVPIVDKYIYFREKKKGKKKTSLASRLSLGREYNIERKNAMSRRVFAAIESREGKKKRDRAKDATAWHTARARGRNFRTFSTATSAHYLMLAFKRKPFSYDSRQLSTYIL